MAGELHVKTIDEMTARELHDVLRLRVDVFVVEQACPYPEIDGRDADPSTRHLWIDGADGVAATIRLLDDGDQARIGRVATAPQHRGRGHARRLVEAAIALSAARPIVLDAQSHLRGWYGALGFVVDGPEFVEDGIAHLPMRRALSG
ncbi:GNAT family N-acetyltransferase [Cumulibacter manganitolerans]|uniref:GNAT family N-acetyltransferase n=1 Tax=Cumulibacter manganitolerans TaxID=1884992 RepID=UPI001294FD7C|nr:GNAT family N-acetyltransferase [Cumulibacter manganitolerans]